MNTGLSYQEEQDLKHMADIDKHETPANAEIKPAHIGAGIGRCPYELFVIKYFGLPEDVSFNKTPRVTYADIVAILCMFTEEKQKY